MALRRRKPAPASSGRERTPRREGPGARGGKGPRPPSRPPTAPGGEGLYGINPVQAALQARRRVLRQLCLKAGRPSEKLALLRWLAEQARIPVSEHTQAELESMAGSPNHQGVVLRCGPLPLLPESKVWETPLGDPPLLLALDEVEDPRNLGAVVRCAAAFGAQGVVLTRRHTAPPGAVASKASAGTLETLPVYEVGNLSQFLAQAKERGYWVAGSAVGGGTHLPEFQRDRPLVLVLGNEGRGMRELVTRHCDFLLTIPLAGGGSLNVAAAAAVLLYHLRPKTEPPPPVTGADESG